MLGFLQVPTLAFCCTFLLCKNVQQNLYKDIFAVGQNGRVNGRTGGTKNSCFTKFTFYFVSFYFICFLFCLHFVYKM
ncbi:MAG: hypothetical protein EOP33_08640 [Rickettsiaceae bacterium]|nr:MAG: hypothetical protein EOP33_08640 [Rickettsiaceae bacterium]